VLGGGGWRNVGDDDSDTYGKYIASELKTFDEHTSAQIKHTFNNVNMKHI